MGWEVKLFFKRPCLCGRIGGREGITDGVFLFFIFFAWDGIGWVEYTTYPVSIWLGEVGRREEMREGVE